MPTMWDAALDLIVSIEWYCIVILTYFGIGLFSYCTCGHCGRENIVCPSVSSVDLFIHTYYQYHLCFFQLDLHCRIGKFQSWSYLPYWIYCQSDDVGALFVCLIIGSVSILN